MAGQYLSFRRYPILQEPHPKTLQDREKNKKNPRLDAAAIPNYTPAPRLLSHKAEHRAFVMHTLRPASVHCLN
jgi:hypothetical protein